MHRYVRVGKRLSVIATVLTLVTTVSSCGLLGASDESAAAQGGGGLEKTSIKVSIMKTTDLAPFHLAMKTGYFREAGFTFDPAKDVVVSKSSGQSTDKLVAGEVDIAYSSYQPFFLAEGKGAAKPLGGVKLVADASSAGPGSCVVVALPDSSVKSVRDMAGKRVAVTGASSVSALLVSSAVKTNGVDPTSIKWVPTPFEDTAARLKAGDVDAAFLTEPFLTGAQKTVGAVPVFDTATGPTANLPSAGWASTGNFVTANPNTVAAFQRVMQKATDEAKSDRSKVEPLLVEFSGVDNDTAKLATLLTFQSTLDATRLQRVPDLMLEFRVITTKMDVSTMIVPTAPVS